MELMISACISLSTPRGGAERGVGWEEEEEEEGFRVRRWGGLEHTHKGRKERTKKKKPQKLGVIECHCCLHLRRTHNATINGGRMRSRAAGWLRVWCLIFFFCLRIWKPKEALDHPTMLPYTLYQQLHTCIHTLTHTKVDWSIWSWWGGGGLLSHPFPCYCASWHAELSWCWLSLDVCFHAVTGEAGVNAILSFIGTPGLVLHWTLGPVVLIVGRFLRPTESPCNASLCTYRCKRSGQRRNGAKVCQWVTLNLTSASQKNFPVILIVWEQRIQVGRSWFRRPSNARALLEVCFHSENALLTLAVCLSVQGFRDVSEHKQLHSWRK